MVTTGVFTIRTMIRKELDLALDWAAAEGWNPGLHDADSFFATDPGGFLIGELDDRPVGCVSAVTYGNVLSFLGFFLMAKEHRGSGYGFQLGQAALQRAGTCPMGLDGVVAQQENYRKAGFVPAWRNVRYGGRGGGSFPTGLVDVSLVPSQEVISFDAEHFGVARPVFVRHWIQQQDALGLAVLEQDRLVGYGVIRACRMGFKIGPLFARGVAQAERLFNGLAAYAKEAPLFIDVPEPNTAAVALARRHGMSPVFETARMYKGTPPNIPIEQVFGITTFELG